MQSGGGATLLGLLAAAGWRKPAAVRAQTWNSTAFDTHSVADALKGLGVGEPTRSKDIVFFQTPEIAENGAVVPVGVTSNIAKTESIAILDRKEPEHARRGVQHSRRDHADDRRPASRWRRVRTSTRWCAPTAGITSPPRRLR